MNHKLSIIIPTLNRAEYLNRCLRSIQNQSQLPYEVVIVDQSDDEKTKVMLERFEFASVKLKYFYQKKKSLIDARNQGIDLCEKDSDFIGFLDDEICLSPNYFSCLLEILNQKSDVAAAMGTIDQVKRNESWFRRFFLMPMHGDGTFFRSGAPKFPHGLEREQYVEFISGGMTIYRSDVLRQYRFDPVLGGTGYGYGDDVDIAYRISRKYRMYYDPKAYIIDDPDTPGRDPGLLHRRYSLQNYYYLLNKNVGKDPVTKIAFFWMLLGFIIDDIRYFRKGALLGNFLALKNIVIGNLDSLQR